MSNVKSQFFSETQDQSPLTFAVLWQALQAFPASILKTLLGLGQFMNHHGRCDPGQRGIAEKAELSPGSVNSAIKALVELGIVIQCHRGHKETCVYQVTTRYIAPVKEMRRQLTPDWWKGWQTKGTRPVQRSIFDTKGYARNQQQESYPETPVPDAARASARREGQGEQQGSEASQPARGGLSEPPASDQANRPALNANNSGSSASGVDAGPRRRGLSPSELERRARQRAKAAVIRRNMLRNMLLTMNRWVRFNLAGDELLGALELLARCELAVHDWGGRSGADILAFDALRGRERRNRLSKEIAAACWRAEHGQAPNHGLEAAKARGWGATGRAGVAPGLDEDWREKSPYRGRAAA